MADRYLVKSGNWSDTSVWSATSGGSGGASVPGAGDDARIDSNNTVTLTADTTCSGVFVSDGTFDLAGYNLTTGYFSLFDSANVDLSNSTVELATPDPNGNGNFIITGSSVTLNTAGSLIIANFSYTDISGYHFFDTGSYTFNDIILNLGVDTASSATVNLTGSPTFRSLIIQSKNSAAHTVNLDDMTVSKFVAIGSSSSNKLTITNPDFHPAIDFTTNGSSYGQNVNISYVDATGAGVPKYIGSNSVSSNATGWLAQDPPKISTLVDPLTTAPGSNDNWTVSGTVTQTTSGAAGGGYLLASGAIISSTNTYDLTGSSIIYERPPESIGNPSEVKFGIDGIGQFVNGPGTTGVWGEIDSYELPTNEYMYGSIYSSGWGGNTGFDYPISSSKYVKFEQSGSSLIESYSDDGLSWTVGQTMTLDDMDLLMFKSARIMADSSYGAQAIGSINLLPSTLSTDQINFNFKADSGNFIPFFMP